MTSRPPPEYCAVCGAPIPRNARACPECGADERTGWDEPDSTDGLDLPDEDDTAAAHRAFLREQDGDAPRTSRQWFWWAVGVFLILALLLGAIRFR